MKDIVHHPILGANLLLAVVFISRALIALAEGDDLVSDYIASQGFAGRDVRK